MLISCKIFSFSLFIFLEFVANTASPGKLPGVFFPTNNILINCGTSGTSTSLDGRNWTGDIGSKFISSVVSNDTAYQTLDLETSINPVPYETVRVFHSLLTYSFHVSPGPKFVRFYFNPDSAKDLNGSEVFFSVTISPFTLLSNFSPSSYNDSFVKEFCLIVEDDLVLKITFTPSNSHGAYGFINGLEILSVPSNLYYTDSGYRSIRFLGRSNGFLLQNNTALEKIYRLNVGGSSILPVNDSGMFRGWTEDNNFLLNLGSSYINSTTEINFTAAPSFSAPREVYQSVRSISEGMNLTWKLPVDSGFKYLVRLHFCELQQKIKKGDRVFQIFIADQMAETSADIINWAGSNRIPVFRDYVVMIPKKKSEKRNNLSISLLPTGKSDPILNGLELFKINNTGGSLHQHIPEASVSTATHKQPEKQAKKSRPWITKILAISGAIIGLIMVLIFIGFMIFWYCRRARFSEESTKSLPEGICRRFTAEEIRNATDNFDRDRVIGDGGFGRVFKGYIDIENTPVAIKALKPTSSQGSCEFWTEIEMLSKLRHNHLVSLIGYCNDQHLMILVYDYMANGTLRDHLYQTQNPPLQWKQRLEICIGAARGIKYLHTGTDHSIIHRDIKSSNILLDENWVPKVSDFGMSRLGPTSLSRSHVTTEVKGTFGYLDPDYYYTHHLSVKSDVFSFGVLLFEVLCARPAVDMKLEEEQHSLVLWARQHVKEGTLDQIIDPKLIGEIAPECLKVYSRIAVKCLRDQRNERPTMSNVIKKLELALKLQESADFEAEEGIVSSGSEGEGISHRQVENSGCLIHSCPTFWPKTLSSNKEQLKFYSERARVKKKMARKPHSLRGLRGLFFAIFAYKSLPKHEEKLTDSSSCEPDLRSEEMLIEIMASQD